MNSIRMFNTVRHLSNLAWKSPAISTKLIKSVAVASTQKELLHPSFPSATANLFSRSQQRAVSSDTDSSSDYSEHFIRPRIQHEAPDFQGKAVIDGQFKEIKLADYKDKWLILLFYPLDFTFVCPTEIIAFSDKADKFRELNTEIVAVSTDSHFSHLAWTNLPRKEGGLGKMNIALLSDFNKIISEDYDVLLGDQGIALRGMFLIDPKGVLRQITVNDLPVGRNVDEALRLVQAFQFVEKEGEVCPAGWLPKSENVEKSATIKPDPKAAKEYFRNVPEKK